MDELGGQLLYEAFSNPLAVRIVVWVGLGLLSVAFGALMWVHREESQTLSHAIALSIFAHLLLITFCYSTDIFTLPPGPDRDGDPFSVTLAGNVEDDPNTPNGGEQRPTEDAPEATPDKPWESPANEPPVAPPLPTAERPEPEPRTDDPIKESAPTPLAANLPDAPITPPSDDPAPPTTAIAATPIETPPAASPTEARRDDLPQPTETPEARPSPLERAALPPTPARTEQDIGPAPIPVRAVSTAASSPRHVTAAAVPAMLRNRLAENRGELVRRGGGDARTEAAVEAALRWLAAHQAADGHWDPDELEGGQDEQSDAQHRPGAGAEADTGITGLSLLAFLAGGHSHYDGPYRVSVQRGLEYLLRQQGRDGSLAGKASPYAAMYCHGMATLALAEAYALTGDERIRPFLERAVNYTLAAQHPAQGGWRYRPGDLGDMSQFGWQVMALKSAQSAGLDIPVRNRNGMLRFLAQASLGTKGGLAAYRTGERPTPTMTAEALACRLFLGTEKEHPAVREAVDYMMDNLPRDGERANLYYWYYGTLALYQVQGEAWQKWNATVRERLLASQATEGVQAGSWDTTSQWGGYGGRAFTTSLAALCLQSYYRFAAIDDDRDAISDDDVNVAGRPRGWIPR